MANSLIQVLENDRPVYMTTRLYNFLLKGMLCFLFFSSCSKDEIKDNEEIKLLTDSTPLITIPPTTVPLANTVGFFMDDWEGKAFIAPDFTNVVKPAAVASITVTADYSSTIGKVSKYLFGNNTNPYMGQLANEPILVNHLKNLSPNVLRFPGGNLASLFFWNAEASRNPNDVPPVIFNAEKPETANFWYGKNNATWTLSLDNYYNLLRQTNSTGIITVNYSYARYGTSEHPDRVAAHLAADWVRYDKGKTKYWEIGNEDAGSWQAGYKINTALNKDGQPEIITGVLYGQHFKIFADSMRKAALEVGSIIKIGGQLIQYDASIGNNSITDRNWNSGFLGQAGNVADFYIVHTYYTPYGQNSSASVILNTAATESKMIMDFMKKTTQENGAILKPIAMTEWNIFAEGSKQQVSHIAGMHATMVLGELIKNNYGMASRWDLANGWANGNDHGMFSLADEGDGTSKWTPRPAFYAMYYFQKLFGDRMITSTVYGSSDVKSYASGYSSGEAAIVLVNTGTNTHITNVNIKNFSAGTRFYYYTLTGSNDNGEFSRKVIINDTGPKGPSGGPENYQVLAARSSVVNGDIKLSLPARSIVFLMVDKK